MSGEGPGRVVAEALDNRTEFGVWGGMTERERRALLRRKPHITSWWSMFAAAGAGWGEQTAVAS